MAGFSSTCIWFFGAYLCYAIYKGVEDIDGWDDVIPCFFRPLQDHKWTYLLFIPGTISLVYYIVLGIKWLVLNVFSTTAFWIILGSIVGVVGIVLIVQKLLDSVQYHRGKELVKRIKEQNAIPFPNDSIYSKEKYSYYLKRINEVEESIKTIRGGSDNPNSKVLIADKKLLFFYECSLKEEAWDIGYSSYELFEPFIAESRKKNDVSILRQDVQRVPTSSLVSMKRKLNQNKMDGVLKGFNASVEKDVTTFGLFTDSKKQAAQTTEMKGFYNAAISEYKELGAIRDKLNTLLAQARLCAYRNIYLGVELLNLIRDNSGGKNLCIEKSQIDLKSIDEQKITSFDVASFDGIANFSDCLDAIANNKGLQYLSKESPKEAMGAAALAVVGDYLLKRGAAINKNNDLQIKMVESIDTIVTAYEEGRGSAYRVIEIVGAIIKANEGFMSIYTPLKEKYLDRGLWDDLDMMGIMQLVKSIKAYNTIANSKV